MATQSGDFPPRHRTLRSVLNTAWARLPPDQRQTWATLALLPAGFTRDSAAAVTGATFWTLEGLIEQSLLLWRDAAAIGGNDIAIEIIDFTAVLFTGHVGCKSEWGVSADWFVISNAGETLNGQHHHLRGTLGQVAPATLTGSGVTLAGGYWSVSTTGVPTAVTLSDAAVVSRSFHMGWLGLWVLLTVGYCSKEPFYPQ